MRRAAWIAADLITEAAGSWPLILLGAFLGLWLPFQAGVIDGIGSRLAALPDMRRSLVMNASWPALAILGLHAQVFFPRRLRRELEPLLASGVSDLEIAFGLALPSLGATVISVPLIFALNMGGFHLTAGRFPAGLWGELGMTCLAVPAAAVWLTACSVDASFRAASAGGFAIRMLAGYLALGAVDVACAGLAIAGLDRLAPPLLALALAGGAAALSLVPLRLDREDLIRRI